MKAALAAQPDEDEDAREPKQRRGTDESHYGGNIEAPDAGQTSNAEVLHKMQPDVEEQKQEQAQASPAKQEED